MQMIGIVPQADLEPGLVHRLEDAYARPWLPSIDKIVVARQ